MPAERSRLDLLTIPTPCTMPWASMRGDDRKRFCDSCSLHVYDVSQMTRPEAEAFLLRSEGRVCARLWRRVDGTLITKDCGRIRLAIERRTRWLRVAAAAILGAVGLAGCESSPPGSFVTSGAMVPWPSPPPKPATTDLKPVDPNAPLPPPRPDGR